MRNTIYENFILIKTQLYLFPFSNTIIIDEILTEIDDRYLRLYKCFKN